MPTKSVLDLPAGWSSFEVIVQARNRRLHCGESVRNWRRVLQVAGPGGPASWYERCLGIKFEAGAA